MKPKLVGCCTKCDAEVFDIVNTPARKLGAPHEDAMRLNFVLADGSRMDLTFCKACTEGLTPFDYPHIWQRVMEGWICESGADHPGVTGQVDNTILGLINMKPYSEVLRGRH